MTTPIPEILMDVALVIFQLRVTLAPTAIVAALVVKAVISGGGVLMITGGVTVTVTDLVTVPPRLVAVKT